jgi:hypothetical protein
MNGSAAVNQLSGAGKVGGSRKRTERDAPVIARSWDFMPDPVARNVPSTSFVGSPVKSKGACSRINEHEPGEGVLPRARRTRSQGVNRGTYYSTVGPQIPASSENEVSCGPEVLPGHDARDSFRRTGPILSWDSRRGGRMERSLLLYAQFIGTHYPNSGHLCVAHTDLELVM